MRAALKGGVPDSSSVERARADDESTHVGNYNGTAHVANPKDTIPLNNEAGGGEFVQLPFSAHSLFSDRPITPTESYDKMMNKQRTLYVLYLAALIFFGPLVFRYVMGAYSPDEDTTIVYRELKNATIATTVNFDDCVACSFYSGVTLRNIVIDVTDVTVPDRSGNTPSIAIFASQDMVRWYNLYVPKQPQDAYVRDYDTWTFNINNGSLACLGGVYSSYIAVCLNNRDLAMGLSLGEPVEGPPFNDRCFQMSAPCGTVCVNSATNGGQYPPSCSNGAIDLSLLTTEGEVTQTIEGDDIEWGGGLHFIEWIVLLVIFLDTFGNILKSLPMVSGRPTELESSKLCCLDGIAALTCASPFVSEDESVFLRSLLGRTCTILRTVGGRHSIQGLYVDTILNEKRGKGETVRFHLWLAWLEFITRVVDVTNDLSLIDADGTGSVDMEGSSHSAAALAKQQDGSTHSIYPGGDTGSVFSGYRESTVSAAGYIRSHAMANVLASSHPAAIVVDAMHDPVATGGRESIFSGRGSLTDVRPPVHAAAAARGRTRTVSGGEIKVKASDGRPSHLLSSDAPVVTSPLVGQTKAPQQQPTATAAKGETARNNAPASRRSSHTETGQHERTFNMAQLIPLLTFLDGWLHIVKTTEWTFDYFNKG
jgi:hypothetical protein